MKKGDSISMFTRPKDLHSSNDYAFVSDIARNGVKWMDQPRRNLLAKEESKRLMLMSYGILAVFIIIGNIYNKMQQRKAKQLL